MKIQLEVTEGDPVAHFKSGRVGTVVQIGDNPTKARIYFIDTGTYVWRWRSAFYSIMAIPDPAPDAVEAALRRWRSAFYIIQYYKDEEAAGPYWSAALRETVKAAMHFSMSADWQASMSADLRASWQATKSAAWQASMSRNLQAFVPADLQASVSTALQAFLPEHAEFDLQASSEQKQPQ